MQAYSMDLRERALLDSDAGMKAADVASWGRFTQPATVRYEQVQRSRHVLRRR